ncbi:MAG: hypothetical protein DI573_04335 [Microbacterium sp.]|uniref:hypothetical protein n=1 Tax=Microbacterium sp. TaxID=51671 RepID=UPI000DB8D647|nr:hypothetical protein [Microbacterium sp.]PZU40355.1 MAG: hypothetical protein DI573_04335 [Microbacterium sp.]
MARLITVDPARGRFPEHSPEAAMLRDLGAYFGTPVAPVTITVDDSTRFEVEGSDAAASFFVQLIANAGSFTSAHRNRVSANLFKLAWLKQSLFPDARLALCITPTVTQAFAPAGWSTLAAGDLGVELLLHQHGSVRPFDPTTR